MRYCALAACILFSTVPPAAAINPNAGTTGFNFLKIGVGTRAAALGGAYAAVPGTIESSAWNPAGLSGLDERTAALAYNSYFVDSQAGFASIAVPKGSRVHALSVHYVSHGDLLETDLEGKVLGTFSATDLAAYLSFAQPLGPDWLVLGANLKAVYSTMAEFSADAYLADLGLLVHAPLEGTTLGATIANLGFVRSGYTAGFKDSLPVHIRLGMAHRLAHLPVPALLVADFNLPNDNDSYLAFGLEVQLADGLYIRPGYSTQSIGSRDEGPVGLSAGAGLTMRRYSVDYAYSSSLDLGPVHRVSLIGTF